MKLPTLLSLLLVSAAVAGCLGDDDGDDHGSETFTCEDGTILDLEAIEGHHDEGFDAESHCPDGDGHGDGDDHGDGNETVVPNIPPTISLSVSDANGTTNSTMLGGSLTFDATGSADEDGTLEGVAVVVTDSNQTRAASLFANGAFTPQTFMFDRPGVVSVIVSALDDSGDITTLETEVYVNHPQPGKGFGFNLADYGANSATDCQGFFESLGGANPVDPLIFAAFKFDVLDGATSVTAEVVSGTAEIAICDPELNAISEAGSSVTTADGTNFTKSIDYFVAAIPQGVPPVGNDVVIDVTVFYDG
ncbi:MAG: hypothetical protein ACPGQL_02940 [Thermoplasmatota archaeon]